MKKLIAILPILVFALVIGFSTQGDILAFYGTEMSEENLTLTGDAALRSLEVATDGTTSYLPVIMNNGDGSSDILFSGDSISYSGSGAVVNGSVITITASGKYAVSGTLNDGQIIVDSDDEEAVELILNGVDITSSTNAPIFISSAEEVVITLADGSQNYLTDGDDYVFEDGKDEPDAALFSKDDVVIQGTGSLTVSANYNCGIVSKDDLEITGGVITVTAVKHALKGKDSITIADGTFVLNAGSDGMQSDNNEDSDKGVVSIEGGTFDITAGSDDIQAETTLTINGGTFVITSGGGSNFTADDSAKGLKAGVNIVINGGMFDIDSADDSIHSDESITINDGTFTLATADDAIHSETIIEINNGDIDITACFEGIESVVIVVNDGNIHIVADDDGINIAGGNDDPIGTGDYHLDINGGYIVVDAQGDGLDANGSINMTAGVVLINGPTHNGDGAVDYDDTFAMTGGFLVAVGSSGMAQAPTSAASTQYSVLNNYSSSQSAGTMIHIEDQSGTDILTFVPTKMYQSVLLSSPDLAFGDTYTIYAGGSSTGTETDGLYSGGIYMPGTQITSFTISSMVTIIGGGPPHP